MTARMQSQVLGDFERYAFELLLVSCVGTDGQALPTRVLGPSAEQVSERAAPLMGTPAARVVRAFVEAHAGDIHRCVLESSRFGRARGRVAIWVRRSVPAARAATVAAAEGNFTAPSRLASA